MVHRTPDHFTDPLDCFLFEKFTEMGCTRAEFARLIGVSPQCLNNWLKGRCSPGDTAYQRIRELFSDVPPRSPGGAER